MSQTNYSRKYFSLENFLVRSQCQQVCGLAGAPAAMDLLFYTDALFGITESLGDAKYTKIVT